MEENINKISDFNVIKFGNSIAEFEGPKLAKLVLEHVTVIDRNEENDHFLKSGCYIMYPWNGRLKSDEKLKEIMQGKEIEYPFLDQNNYPIHGLYMNTPRVVSVEYSKDSAGLTMTPTEESLIKEFPKFTEKFTLTANSLSVTTTFTNNTERIQYFAYAYHPYLGVNTTNTSNSINSLTLKSNLDIHCMSTIELLPALNEDNTTLMAENCELNIKVGGKSFDDFYFKNPIAEDNPYVSIHNEELNKTVTLTAENNYSELDKRTIQLDYFQIFTPVHRSCIAVEPMSSPNNAFNIDFPNNLVVLNPGESAVGKFNIYIQ